MAQQLRMLPASSAVPLSLSASERTDRNNIWNRHRPTSGKRPLIAHCVADGSLTLTWQDTSTTVVSFIAGDDFSMVEAEAVAVTTGTFHFA